MLILRAVAAVALAVWTVSSAVADAPEAAGEPWTSPSTPPGAADNMSVPTPAHGAAKDEPRPRGNQKSRPRTPSSSSSYQHKGMPPEDMAAHESFRGDKSRRMAERRERAKAKIRSRLSRPEGKLERMSADELNRVGKRAELAELKEKAKVDAKMVEAEAEAQSEAKAYGTTKGRRRRAVVEKESDQYYAATSENHAWLRRTNYFSSSNEGGIPSDYDPYGYVGPGLVDPSGDYDYWSQGYRMLGGFIDCDHDMGGDGRRMRQRRRAEAAEEGSDGERDQDERDLSGSGDGGDNFGCSRWMMWASYMNPNYQGKGYDEYFGDGCGDDGSESCGTLDCHDPSTEWELIGVYRQEFYQYVEQISKHLWAIDEYEYVVALAGLAYMTDYDCRVAGYDGNGDVLYTGVQPLEGGRWQMSMYEDQDCLILNEDSGYTYDDFGYESDMALSSKDDGCGDGDDNEQDGRGRGRKLDEGGDWCDQAEEYWEASQEYTLTNLNDVYEDYKYCTPCMDYPTYQDGYFIGDYGTDEDDIINQCWKFHSHDSFTCEGECIALGAAQDTIVRIDYGSKKFGLDLDTSSSSTSESSTLSVSQTSTQGNRLEKLKANLFLTFAGILFVATFLAFAVARGSGRKDRGRSGKSRSLLTPEERARARQSRRSRSSRGEKQSSSRSRAGSRRSKSRSKSKSRRHDDTGGNKLVRSHSRSHSRSKGTTSPRSNSASSPRERDSVRKISSRSRSRSKKSSRHIDDF